MLPLHPTNLDAARLFADSFSIFNNLKFIMIYVFFNLNELIFFMKNKKLTCMESENLINIILYPTETLDTHCHS
jgi:hypothetical protein